MPISVFSLPFTSTVLSTTRFMNWSNPLSVPTTIRLAFSLTETKNKLKLNFNSLVQSLITLKWLFYLMTFYILTDKSKSVTRHIFEPAKYTQAVTAKLVRTKMYHKVIKRNQNLVLNQCLLTHDSNAKRKSFLCQTNMVLNLNQCFDWHTNWMPKESPFTSLTFFFPYQLNPNNEVRPDCYKIR